jgi:hypothetical protein
MRNRTPNQTKTKELVETKRRIAISELLDTGVLKEHPLDTYPAYSGKFRLEWVRDRVVGDKYIKLREPGPNNTCNAIPLVTTKCNYGGIRYWFECPRCERRCGILYENNDNFKCRVCLDLAYYSQSMNYQTLGPTMRRMIKLQDMEYPERKFYMGKPTKKALRYEKLQKQVEIGAFLFGY